VERRDQKDQQSELEHKNRRALDSLERPPKGWRKLDGTEEQLKTGFIPTIKKKKKKIKGCDRNARQ